ncbi:MAG: hypothetical protein J7K46_09465 [Bacteroidales bacterium]|nr:hypothetical protein [Bacteroidales bacterium]
MEKIKKNLAVKIGLPGDTLIPGVYTNGFVSFTIMKIVEENVLLYANADIPYMNISEDDSLEIAEHDLYEMFGDILSDFRLTHAGNNS